MDKKLNDSKKYHKHMKRELFFLDNETCEPVKYKEHGKRKFILDFCCNTQRNKIK